VEPKPVIRVLQNPVFALLFPAGITAAAVAADLTQRQWLFSIVGAFAYVMIINAMVLKLDRNQPAKGEQTFGNLVVLLSSIAAMIMTAVYEVISPMPPVPRALTLLCATLAWMGSALAALAYYTEFRSAGEAHYVGDQTSVRPD
jgi:hypothetical protein